MYLQFDRHLPVEALDAKKEQIVVSCDIYLARSFSILFQLLIFNDYLLSESHSRAAEKSYCICQGREGVPS